MIRRLLIGVALSWAVPASAQEAASEAPLATVTPVPEAVSGRVVAVEINGLRRVEEAAIMAEIDIGPGDELAAWKIRRDLVSVYQTGFVDDVRVDVRPATDQADDGTVVCELDD